MTVAPAAPPVHHGHPARWAQETPAVPPPRRVADDVPGRLVVYGSFACPWSYLASQRDDPTRDPAVRPAWRMVDPEDAPGMRLCAPGRRPDPKEAVLSAARLEAVRALLVAGERLPARPPAFVPHGGPAVVAYAEAVGAGAGDQVRRVLFDAYWQQGLDIGQPDVLRRLLVDPLRAGASGVRCIREHGYAVTLTGGPVTTGAHRLAREWHECWRLLAVHDDLPVLSGEATTTCGGAALAALTPVSTGRTQPTS